MFASYIVKGIGASVADYTQRYHCLEKEMSGEVPKYGSAVHSIDHFALDVPSIAEARHFYSAFGLQVSEVGSGADAHLELRAVDGHRWARILPAARKSLAYLSFSCFESDLDPLLQQLREAGGTPKGDDARLGVSEEHIQPGFWFNDPDGNLIHVGVGPKTSPRRKHESRWQETGSDSRAVLPLSQTATVRPRRMSHVGLFTPDIDRAVNFYQRALGLRLSDRAAPFAAFMHGAHGSDHHIVAFAKSSAKGWHHAAWHVDGVNEVGIGSAQMAAAGYTRGWGTGRHVLGSNYFHYVMDPWGSFSEFSSDIDFVSADVSWQAGEFAPQDALRLWGPDAPPYFVENTEV
ncbi:VOC family protein [Paraburkholderia sp. 2C]